MEDLRSALLHRMAYMRRARRRWWSFRWWVARFHRAMNIDRTNDLPHNDRRNSGDASSGSSQVPLIEACKRNDSVQIRTLLRRGEMVDGPDNKGLTALRVAADNGFADAAQILLEAGADPNQMGNDGWAVIHSAIVEGSSGIVETLLRGGSNPFVKGSYGWNALHTAVASGRHRLVRLILHGGRLGNSFATMDPIATPSPRTAVEPASSSSSSSTPTNINGRHRRDRSNGFVAVDNRTMVRKVMLENGYSDDNLVGAAGSGDVIVGPDPFVTAAAGANVRRHRSTSSLDKARQQSVDAQTEHGQTALHLAAHEGHAVCMRLLLLFGADPNIADMKGRTPLAEACRRCNLVCIKMLLDNGARKNGLNVESYQSVVVALLDSHSPVPSLKAICMLNIRKILKGDGRFVRDMPTELVQELQEIPITSVPVVLAGTPFTQTVTVSVSAARTVSNNNSNNTIAQRRGRAAATALEPVTVS